MDVLPPSPFLSMSICAPVSSLMLLMVAPPLPTTCDTARVGMVNVRVCLDSVSYAAASRSSALADATPFLPPRIVTSSGLAPSLSRGKDSLTPYFSSSRMAYLPPDPMRAGCKARLIVMVSVVSSSSFSICAVRRRLASSTASLRPTIYHQRLALASKCWLSPCTQQFSCPSSRRRQS